MMAEYEAKKDLFPVVEKKEEKTENVGVNIGIWVLTGTIFSFIWRKIIINRVNELSEEKIPTWLWIVSIPVFPLSGIILFKTAKLIKARCDKEGIACKDYSVLSLIFGILGFGIVGYALQQAQLNKMKDL